MKSNLLKIFLLILIIVFVFLFFHFSFQNYLTLSYLKENQQILNSYYLENKNLTIISYFCFYIIVTAFSLPGASILTLAAGAIFGLWQGMLIVSFASSIGASLAFLSSRVLLRNTIAKKFEKQFNVINSGIENDGAVYLLSLRLIPAFPFFMINLVMGLTKISLSKFYFFSQLGMLPGTLVYVNAGKQLASLENLSQIMSYNILGSFILLGLFPFIIKKIMNIFKNRNIYKNFKKPKTFNYNMIAIGAGSAGLVTAYISSAVKAKTALIEKHKMGGDCLNTGCVPSKAIIRSAKIAHHMKSASKYGLSDLTPEIDMKKIMKRVDSVISKIEPHDSVKRYSELGVECFSGDAKILSPWEVQVNGKILTTKNITIATGASPFVPNIPGIDLITPLTSQNLWKLDYLPKKFIILGGGPIGCEMAQSFARLGSKVTQVEMQDRIMSIEDKEVSDILQNQFKEEGITLLLKHKALKIIKKEDAKFLVTLCDDKEYETQFDEILVAVGRKANIEGFGLEELGIKLRENKTIWANEFMQTNFPNIFVCGDVTGPYQLTHTAAHQAWYCAVNGLFGFLKKFKVDYSVIPWATYSDPEVASMGLNEQRAKSQNIAYELVTYNLDDLDRAIADSEDYGVVRVLVKPGSDKILGATIVGNHASDLLLEFITAMKHGIGLNKILGTIHIYPTMGEANKYLAGNWKKSQTSTTTFKWLERLHRLRRS